MLVKRWRTGTSSVASIRTKIFTSLPSSMSSTGCWKADVCEYAWNKDPVFGVIGIQSGPPRRRVHSGFRGGCGGQVGDAGSGDDREDSSGVFRPEQADQDDLP